jgi:hypothetical protein
MVKLPAGATPVVDTMKANVIGDRQSAIPGADLRYRLFRTRPDQPDPGGGYDEGGAIYVSADLVHFDERFADLIALHEQLEVRYKAAGRSHAHAHRRAWAEEALTAKRILAPPVDLARYLRWRVGGYPTWKVPDPEAVATQLADILAADRPRKGDLLRVITAHRL